MYLDMGTYNHTHTLFSFLQEKKIVLLIGFAFNNVHIQTTKANSKLRKFIQNEYKLSKEEFSFLRELSKEEFLHPLKYTSLLLLRC